MAQMAKQQSNFMVENSQLFDDTPSELRDRLVSTTEWEEKETREDPSYPLCLGPNRSQAAITKTNFVCILCQEEEHLTADCNTLVMAAYVQKSTVLSKVRGQAPAPVSSSTFPFLSSNLPAAANSSDDAVDVSDATISDTNTPAMEVAEENRDLVEMVVDNSISSDMITDIIEDMSETVDTAPEAEEAPARASPVTGSVVLDMAVSSSVTVVHSPDTRDTASPLSPTSYHSSSSTELASAHSSYSDTFLSASDSPKVEAKEKSASPEKQPASIAIRAAVTIDFSHLLEALFISLKYRRGLSPAQESPPPNGGEAAA